MQEELRGLLQNVSQIVRDGEWWRGGGTEKMQRLCSVRPSVVASVMKRLPSTRSFVFLSFRSCLRVCKFPSQTWWYYAIK